jgi:LytS/YehU family sensor histidine kinase
MELMQSYLAVEKTRLGDSFTFDVAVKLVSKEYSLLIPPFLLQPIIENSI